MGWRTSRVDCEQGVSCLWLVTSLFPYSLPLPALLLCIPLSPTLPVPLLHHLEIHLQQDDCNQGEDNPNENMAFEEIVASKVSAHVGRLVRVWLCNVQMERDADFGREGSLMLKQLLHIVWFRTRPSPLNVDSRVSSLSPQSHSHPFPRELCAQSLHTHSAHELTIKAHRK